MEYRLVSMFAAGALVAMSSAAPVPSPDVRIHPGKEAFCFAFTVTDQDQNLSITNPPNTIELGKPSSEISWGTSIDTEVTNPDDIVLTPPNSEIIWSKEKKVRSDETTPTNPDDIVLTPPNSEIIWSKEKKARGVEFEKPKDSFNLGNASTVVTWGKRDSTTGVTPEDTIELGEPSTEITWSKEKRDELVTPDDSISLAFE
ncbi:hypothetical protein J3E73DRAFT_256734 [Bipolaris maydis]|nr:hypothetical protein J3E73DRAFT_256734 [Bipolaris maydis]